ncbi:hypothetical protein GW17_00014538 [Ensete ventricosum]|nr:hypothetical protein GW17_00014538 [Ensete ventricosum]
MRTACYRAVPLIRVLFAPLPPEIGWIQSISTIASCYRAVMVDFDSRVLSGGISQGRKKKKENKRDNLEIQPCSPDPDPSPAGFSVFRKENLR